MNLRRLSVLELQARMDGVQCIEQLPIGGGPHHSQIWSSIYRTDGRQRQRLSLAEFIRAAHVRQEWRKQVAVCGLRPSATRMNYPVQSMRDGHGMQRSRVVYICVIEGGSGIGNNANNNTNVLALRRMVE